jgi:hypothetical protein
MIELLFCDQRILNSGVAYVLQPLWRSITARL